MQNDIIIVGGGLNGPALALALAQTGHFVTIIDALSEKVRKNAGFDGRSYALALASKRLLDGIGVWPAIDGHAQPMLEIKVTDGRAGEGPSPFFMHFDHAEIEEGPMGFMVEDRHLRRAFLDALASEPRITHLSGKTVVAQDTDANGATVTLDGGQEITGRVLVGSDGRSSGTATRAGIKRTGWGYEQTALVCAVAHEKPHNGIAHQFFMPPGPLAILPLTGNRCSIVWSETDADAKRINAMSDADYYSGKELGQVLGSLLVDLRLFSVCLARSPRTTGLLTKVEFRDVSRHCIPRRDALGVPRTGVVQQHPIVEHSGNFHGLGRLEPPLLS